MKTKSFIKNKFLAALVAIMLYPLVFSPLTYASETSFSVTPMTTEIILEPGEHYTGTFEVHNPATASTNIEYKVVVTPYYASDDEDGAYSYQYDERVGVNNEILDWITFVSGNTGVLAPNENGRVLYAIDVPEDAPGNGQYAAFKVTAKEAGLSGETEESNAGAMGIKQEFAIAHLLFAEVTGETVKSGDILNLNMPSLILSGNITGSSIVKNTGNVHGKAKYTMQVFPLFSSEEIYTNEEHPDAYIVLPDRSRYVETAWKETPAVGIFNVVYTVEFEGKTQQLSKLVIKCPIWLLFTIIFVIAVIALWVVMKYRSRKKSRIKNEDF
ncbi:hypothetical protein IKW73_01810 [Candidatus Saccharibacteria bacterium]|nr:hypothetical protein [Candidatus Saccharibacteria bacterium]